MTAVGVDSIFSVVALSKHPVTTGDRATTVVQISFKSSDRTGNEGVSGRAQVVLLPCYLTGKKIAMARGGYPLGGEFKRAVAFDRVRSSLVVSIG